MRISRTIGRSTSLQLQGLRLPVRFTSTQPVAPTYLAMGTAASTTAAATVSWPRHIADDIGILVIECGGDDATATVSGWTHVTGSPVVDVADITGSKLQVLWRRATSDAEADASISDLGDHISAAIFTVRGVSKGLVPGAISATSTKTVASTSVTYPAITTATPNSMVVCIASRPDDSSSTAVFSAFANASLTGVTEAGERGTVSGHGGGFVVNYGFKATAGSTGTSTGTSSVTVTNACMTFALEPMLVPAS